MNTQLITERVATRGRSLRARAVAALGPLAMLGGVAWALLQPYRITLLHPHGQGFWWLFVSRRCWRSPWASSSRSSWRPA